MKKNFTILMLLISFSAFGQNKVHFKPDYYDDYTYHKDVYEPKDTMLFVLQNADTLAEVQFLVFNFENGIVALLDNQLELLGNLYFIEKDNALFISTDPHWFNYPYQSAYLYCGNNPIMKIDPTGMDEWEINSKGKIVSHCETTEHDAFYMVDKKGNRIAGKEQVFKYGTVKYLLKHGTLYNIQGDEIYKLKMPKGYKIDWQSWGDES